jgi:DDE superfamily endonuclease
LPAADVDGQALGPPATRVRAKKGAITRLLRHPPRGADVYVQDEAELSLFPTRTRTGMLRGPQKKIRAPGVHPPKRQECAATDWRTGHIVRVRSANRDAATFGRLVEKCLKRSARRKRRVILVTDRAKIHTAEGSRRVAELVERSGRRVKLRYVPTYDPDSMPMELLWNDWRDQVTHNHDRNRSTALEHDSDGYFARRTRDPKGVLRTIHSPFAHRRQNHRN